MISVYRVFIPENIPVDLQESQSTQLIELTKVSPSALGYAFNSRALYRLKTATVEREIFVEVSHMSVKRILDAAGISLQKTKTWKESNDPAFEVKKHIKELYNTDYREHAQVIGVDEFGPIEVRPCAGRNWCRKKHPDRQPTTYTRKHGVRHLIAAYDLKEDKMYATLQKHKTNKEFLQFLKQLHRKYDSQITLFIVCDNYGPHKTENVITWAAKNKIEFYFTPTNASWLNKIEPQFNPLKSNVLRNSNYQNHDEIDDAIHKWFFFRNSKRYRDFVPSSRK